MTDFPTHIVAGGAFVTRSPNEILLVRTPRRGWETPGGQVEHGETLLEAVHREVAEEAGVQVGIGSLVGVYSNIKAPTKVIFLFMATWRGGEAHCGAEVVDVRWVDRSEAAELISDGAERDRVGDALRFDGRVRYRVYETRPYVIHDESWM